MEHRGLFLTDDLDWGEAEKKKLFCLKDTHRPLHTAGMFDPRGLKDKHTALDQDDRSFEYFLLDLENRSLRLGPNCLWTMQEEPGTQNAFFINKDNTLETRHCPKILFVNQEHSQAEVKAFQREAESKALVKPRKQPARKIWSFWDKGLDAAPAFEQRIVAIWKKLHPDWEVRVLNLCADDPNFINHYLNRKDLPPTFDLMHPVLQSDFIRLAVLKQQGGIWLDLSVLLTQSLDSTWLESLKHENTDLIGFSQPQSGMSYFGDKQHFESYAFGAKPWHPTLSAWLKALSFIFEFRFSVFDIFSTRELALNPYANESKEQMDWHVSRDYLVVYIGLRKALEDNTGIREHFVSHTHFMDARTDGALWFHFNLKWDIKKTERNLLDIFDTSLFQGFKDRGLHKFINHWSKLINKRIVEDPEMFKKSTLGQVLTQMEEQGHL